MKEFKEKVSVWRNGALLTAQMDKETAKELLLEGKAKVISKGHIELVK